MGLLNYRVVKPSFEQGDVSVPGVVHYRQWRENYEEYRTVHELEVTYTILWQDCPALEAMVREELRFSPFPKGIDDRGLQEDAFNLGNQVHKPESWYWATQEAIWATFARLTQRTPSLPAAV